MLYRVQLWRMPATTDTVLWRPHVPTLRPTRFEKNEHQLHCFANHSVTTETPTSDSSNSLCPPHLPHPHCDGVSRGLYVRVVLVMLGTVAPTFQPLTVF